MGKEYTLGETRNELRGEPLPPREEKKCCDDCRYFVVHINEREYSDGLCYFDPPVRFDTDDDRGIRDLHPAVSGTDFCSRLVEVSESEAAYRVAVMDRREAVYDGDADRLKIKAAVSRGTLAWELACIKSPCGFWISKSNDEKTVFISAPGPATAAALEAARDDLQKKLAGHEKTLVIYDREAWQLRDDCNGIEPVDAKDSCDESNAA